MPAYSDGASPMAEHALKKERSFCRRLSRSRLRAHPGQLSFVNGKSCSNAPPHRLWSILLPIHQLTRPSNAHSGFVKRKVTLFGHHFDIRRYDDSARRPVHN
jgi:hypothetical protein